MAQCEVPVREFVWTADFSFHRTLTCRNHRGSMYITKNPWQRTLHYVKQDPSVVAEGKFECECPFDDLVVIDDGE